MTELALTDVLAAATVIGLFVYMPLAGIQKEIGEVRAEIASVKAEVMTTIRNCPYCMRKNGDKKE